MDSRQTGFSFTSTGPPQAEEAFFAASWCQCCLFNFFPNFFFSWHLLVSDLFCPQQRWQMAESSALALLMVGKASGPQICVSPQSHTTQRVGQAVVVAFECVAFFVGFLISPPSHPPLSSCGTLCVKSLVRAVTVHRRVFAPD